MTTETGLEADARRLNALVRPDGSVQVPHRLTQWVRSLLEVDLAKQRRAGMGGNLALDILLTLDALTLAEMTGNGPESGQIGRIIADASAESDGFMNTAQASDILECSARSVTRMISSGRLPAQRLGHEWLISAHELEVFRHNRTGTK